MVPRDVVGGLIIYLRRISADPAAMATVGLAIIAAAYDQPDVSAEYWEAVVATIAQQLKAYPREHAGEPVH